MKTLRYQEKAVSRLVEMSIELLQGDEDEQNLVFKAPTGSGKTIMATRVLASVFDEAGERGLPSPAFVWIAPQKLHLQSFEKLKRVFAEDRKLTPILYDDIDRSEGVVKPGEILFVNWESVNKEGNLMVKEREDADSFFEILDRTRLERHRPIYLIVDEEHRNWSKNADKSLAVVRKIHPKVELRISATPKTVSFHAYEIPRREVVAEEMIKKGIWMNEDIDVNNSDPGLNMHLLHKALDMRAKIAREYKRLGVDINPLLLIQLPNDTSESLSSDERTLAESLVQMLATQYNISEENGLLGTWLSGKKTIGDEISRNNDMTQVLLFKQAIALGWDCPRAAVLLIFRNLQEETFTVQTLGRILRMPEQKFYPSDILNNGHVYTDISRDAIRIAAEDSNYISKDTLLAERRAGLNNITLVSYHAERRAEDQNRLGPMFKKTLRREIAAMLKLTPESEPTLFTIDEMQSWTPEEREKYENPLAEYGTTVEFNRKRADEVAGLNLDVKTINQRIPKDVFFQNDEHEIDLSKNSSSFARTQGEVRNAFLAFCRRMVVQAHFEPKSSTKKLAGTLAELMEEFFGIFEAEVPKVVLSNDNIHHNRPKFERTIAAALASFADSRRDRLKAARERALKQTTWEVPEERFYNINTNVVVPEAQNHALLPFVREKNASNPERGFEAFLERNTQFIDWWYKNGDEGMTNYSIPYTNRDGERALFYVDFIVRMKSGEVFLFDTKSEESDPNAPAKHNALREYMAAENAKGRRLDGGVIIGSGDLWRFSEFKIENTHDTDTWQGFFPDQHK